MLKVLVGSIAIASLLAIAPVAAAEMDCTDANMTKANADMEKMPAGEKKSMAMKEMSRAREMMQKKDMAGCKTHMNKAEMGMSKQLWKIARRPKVASLDHAFIAMDTEVTLADVPVQQTIDDVHQAAGLIDGGKYYEASQLLRQPQDAERYDVTSISAEPTKKQ